MGFPGGSAVKNLPAVQEMQAMRVPSTAQEDPPEEGNPLQHSCLENPMDRGAWWTRVHGIIKSQFSSVQLLSRVQLFATPWTIPHQAPLSMGFSRQEYRSGLPCPLQGIFPTQRSNPGLLHWQADSLPLSHQGTFCCNRN